ncbi:MAG: hypothetical protein M3O88_01625 [Actinomycetota bacterium]|nr:hypothetical protein [Actinomycetota bacterium]
MGMTYALVSVALLAAGCTKGATAGTPSPTSSGRRSVSGTERRQTPRLRLASAGYRLASPVERAVAVQDGKNVYVAGGLDSTGVSGSQVFSMDPSTGHLSVLGSVPSAFHDAAGAMIRGQVFVFGGGPSTGTDLVQAIDPATGSGSVVAHLPVALSDLSSAVVGRTVYLVGGYDGTSPRREIYATTNGRRFTVAARLPVGLRYAAATAIGSEVVIAGGMTDAGPRPDVYAFDTAQGTLRRLGRLPQAVAHAAAFVEGGLVYVAGGQDAAGNAVDTVTSIDPASGAVKAQTPLRRPLSDAAVVPGSDETLLIGGWRGSALDQVLVAKLASTNAGGSP